MTQIANTPGHHLDPVRRRWVKDEEADQRRRDDHVSKIHDALAEHGSATTEPQRMVAMAKLAHLLRVPMATRPAFRLPNTEKTAKRLTEAVAAWSRVAPMRKGRRLLVHLRVLNPRLVEDDGYGQLTLRKAAQLGLFGGGAPPVAKPSTVEVKQHVAANPGGGGVHVVKSHERHVDDGARPHDPVITDGKKRRFSEKQQAAMTEEAKTLLQVDGKRLEARIYGMGYRSYCSRCGGTGHYSFNLQDGTKCYGCEGRGTKAQQITPELLVQIRDDVAQGKLGAYLDELREKADIARRAKAADKEVGDLYGDYWRSVHPVFEAAAEKARADAGARHAAISSASLLVTGLVKTPTDDISNVMMWSQSRKITAEMRQEMFRRVAEALPKVRAYADELAGWVHAHPDLIAQTAAEAQADKDDYDARGRPYPDWQTTRKQRDHEFMLAIGELAARQPRVDVSDLIGPTREMRLGTTMSGAPAGYVPVPDSKHGGYRKRRADGRGWDYWYPSTDHARKDATHFRAEAATTGRYHEEALRKVKNATTPSERAQAEEYVRGSRNARMQATMRAARIDEWAEAQPVPTMVSGGASSVTRGGITAHRTTVDGKAQYVTIPDDPETLRKGTAAPGIHAADRPSQIAGMGGAVGPITEAPGTLHTDARGNVLRGVFSVPGYQFEFRKGASGIGILTVTGPRLPLPYHMVVRGYADAKKQAPDVARTFNDGGIPLEGVFRRAGEVLPASRVRA